MNESPKPESKSNRQTNKQTNKLPAMRVLDPAAHAGNYKTYLVGSELHIHLQKAKQEKMYIRTVVQLMKAWKQIIDRPMSSTDYTNDPLTTDHEPATTPTSDVWWIRVAMQK